MGAVDSSAAAFLLAADQKDLWQQVNATEAAEVTFAATELVHRFTDRTDAPAVISAGRTLTYLELAAIATPLAATLSADANPVAICLEPGWEQVVAVTAALLAGVPFVVVAPTLSQPARWGRLSVTGAHLVLTQSWLTDRMGWPVTTQTIAVDRLPVAPERRPTAPVVRPNTIACWTSDGPVDAPLVPLTNAALSAPLGHLAGRFDIGADDKLLAVTLLDEAVGLSGLVLTLTRGGTVVVPEDIDQRTPSVWVDLIRRERVTVWHSTPALAALLVEHVDGRGDDLPETLRLALLAGEPLSIPAARRLGALGDGVRVVNLLAGGPAALWAACHEVEPDEDRRGHVPVGRPLPGVHVYVLNDSLALCPVWVTGRVHIAGALPVDTSALGSRVPVVPGTGERVHRTDLLGRLLPDGCIEVVGEDATAVTIAGHPVNLRDIEAAIGAHDAVRSATVVPSGTGSVAYVKPAAGSSLTPDDISGHLRKRMSPYLLPERIELVGALPLTPGGQVDRTALAAAATPTPAAAPAPSSSNAPDLVRRACELAAAVLGVPEVAENANLLNLGATSVQVVRLAVQAEQELGIPVDVEELLRFPSVAVLVSFAPTSPPPTAPSTPDITDLILDPVDRAAFTARQPGLRRTLDGRPTSHLPARDAARRRALAGRATYRAFTGEAVPLRVLAELLGAVSRLDDDGVTPKYGYPSAGTLYPVQAYLTVAQGGVAGLATGSYYYHPVDHRLVSVVDGAVVDAATHAWPNRDAFRSSAFTVYLVASSDAIEPMYGARARDYCLIEAGAMLQLLMATAGEVGLGLCPVGDLDAPALSGPLLLNSRHEILHALLGGVPVPDEDTGEEEMLRRIGTLPGGSR